MREAARPARIVLGGPAFSIFPREIGGARCWCADGVMGDGEISARLLVEGGPARRGSWSCSPKGLRDVRLPGDRLDAVFERRRALPHSRRADPRVVLVPLRVHYPRLEGTGLRRRPPEAVADEMERLRVELGSVEQFVVDSSFNADEDHMMAVCEELRRAAQPARRDLGGRPLLVLPAAARERPRGVPAACRGRLHLCGLRHRHRRGAAAAGARQDVHHRRPPRVDGRGARRGHGCVPLAALRGPARRRRRRTRPCA